VRRLTELCLGSLALHSGPSQLPLSTWHAAIGSLVHAGAAEEAFEVAEQLAGTGSELDPPLLSLVCRGLATGGLGDRIPLLLSYMHARGVPVDDRLLNAAWGAQEGRGPAACQGVLLETRPRWAEAMRPSQKSHPQAYWTPRTHPRVRPRAQPLGHTPVLTPGYTPGHTQGYARGTGASSSGTPAAVAATAFGILAGAGFIEEAERLFRD